MRFFTVLFSLFFLNVYCQDISAYNAIYNKTFLETSQKDFNKALQIADSLYKTSETPVFQIKSLMLSATLYDQSGEFEKSLDYALRSEKIVENTDNTLWKAKIYGFLATHYRFVRLFNKSKKYTELGISAIKNIPNPEVSNNMMIMMMQELAYYEIEQKNYKKSIENVKQSQAYINNSNRTDNSSFKAQNEQLLGYNYYYLGNIKESFKHYQDALTIAKDFPENYHTGLIHNGLALIYIKNNDLKKAKEHLDIAKRIADESKYLALKNEVYDTSEKYYALTKNLTDYVKTRNIHDTVKKTLQKNVQLFVNTSYSKVENENTEIKKSGSVKNNIIILTLIIIMVITVLFFSYRKKQRKDIERFKKILSDLDEKQDNIVVQHHILDKKITEEDLDDEAITNPEIVNIPEETLQKILAKLMEFEKSRLYTSNSTISLSYLAIYCETNTKYLSHVIKTYKNKDYNNYINDLRIDFIVDKLRNDAKYRNYKIAVLAEEAGFSSHNKFSMVFKKVTTFSPSVFIKYLNEEEESY